MLYPGFRRIPPPPSTIIAELLISQESRRSKPPYPASVSAIVPCRIHLLGLNTFD
jgi:hypothetical protein